MNKKQKPIRHRNYAAKAARTMSGAGPHKSKCDYNRHECHICGNPLTNGVCEDCDFDNEGEEEEF